jgi:hypothetical protein
LISERDDEVSSNPVVFAALCDALPAKSNAYRRDFDSNAVRVLGRERQISVGATDRFRASTAMWLDEGERQRLLQWAIHERKYCMSLRLRYRARFFFVKAATKIRRAMERKSIRL